MSSSSRPPETPPPADEESGSLVIRFGTVVGAGALAAVAATIPAAMRVAEVDASPSTWRVWIALAGAALVPSAFGVGVLRRARVGLRGLRGPAPAARAMGLVLWTLVALVAFAAIGSVLRAKTHHHALAGVTFAILALSVAASSTVFIARLVAIVERWKPGNQKALLELSIAVLVAALFLACARVSQPSGSPGGAVVVDVLALALAVGFGSRAAFARWRALAIVGPPLAAFVLVLGISTLRSSAPFQDTIRARAPAFAPAVEVLGR